MAMISPPKSFEAYEVVGVITPGAVVALLLALKWPEFRTLLGADGISVGGLGAFIFVAFVLGHLVQALGNIFEKCLWAVHGMPTQWVAADKQSLLTADQLAQLQARVADMEPTIGGIHQIKGAHWQRVTSRIYSRVHSVGKSGRVDTFNRNYGLFRGLAAAFLLCATWLAFSPETSLIQVVVIMSLMLLAVLRMWRCAIQYAQCLFLTFIDLPMSAGGIKSDEGGTK